MKLKGIDGGPHKRWNMRFNSMLREEPYQGLTSRADLLIEVLDMLGSCPLSGGQFPNNTVIDGAWLSEVRAVRCSVKSCNERNPYDKLPLVVLLSDCR